MGSTSITIFNSIFEEFFNERLADFIPKRVLPVSTSPPKNMITFIDSEYSQIRELLNPQKRRQADACCRLRHLMILESSLSGHPRQPNERESNKIIRRLKQGESWQSIFPSIAAVHLTTISNGPTVSIRFTRNPTAAPVQVVREGMSGFEDATVIREVNLLERFSITPTNLANQLGLTSPKTRALIKYINLQEDSECYHEFRMGRTSLYKRYSPKALEKLQEALNSLDIENVWQQYRSRRTNR